MNEQQKINIAQANNILELVRHHKENCESDCGISMYWLLEDFERHMGRKATREEFRVFM